MISSLVVIGRADPDTVSPSSPIAGQPFTVNTTDAGTVTIYTGANLCAATAVVATGTAPNPSFTLAAGGYHAVDGDGDCIGFNVIPAVTSTTTTTSTPIPEYPLGLALLGIVMILAYGLVRRRTRNQ